MSATGRERGIEEQLSTLLNHHAPAVTIEELRSKAPVKDGARRREPRSRVVGLKPGFAWAFALVLLGTLGLGLFVSESSPKASPSAHSGTSASSQISDTIYLTETRVVSGPKVRGDLVIHNPGKPIDLTPRTRDVGGRILAGCEPYWDIYLSNSKVTQEIGFAADCSTKQLLVAHGTTRLPISLITTYTSCGPIGQPPTPNNPTCLRSGAPPLPSGRYFAKILWSQPVALPSPKPVVVTITSGTPPPQVTTTTTIPVATQTEQYQPWATRTMLAPGIRVIRSLSGGDCWTESIPDYENQNAWRCMAGNIIFDPCFAPPGASNVTQVACAETPTSGVYLMNLTSPLSQGSVPRTSGGKYAWYIVLSNGRSCSRVDGAGPPSVDGLTLEYACTIGEAAEPNQSTIPWTDQYAASTAGALVAVDVTQAWN